MCPEALFGSPRGKTCCYSGASNRKHQIQDTHLVPFVSSVNLPHSDLFALMMIHPLWNQCLKTCVTPDDRIPEESGCSTPAIHVLPDICDDSQSPSLGVPNPYAEEVKPVIKLEPIDDFCTIDVPDDHDQNLCFYFQVASASTDSALLPPPSSGVPNPYAEEDVKPLINLEHIYDDGQQSTLLPSPSLGVPYPYAEEDVEPLIKLEPIDDFCTVQMPDDHQGQVNEQPPARLRLWETKSATRKRRVRTKSRKRGAHPRSIKKAHSYNAKKKALEFKRCRVFLAGEAAAPINEVRNQDCRVLLSRLTASQINCANSRIKKCSVVLERLQGQEIDKFGSGIKKCRVVLERLSDQGINKLGSAIKKCRVVLERLSDQEINKLGSAIKKCRVVLERPSDQEINKLGSAIKKCRVVLERLSDQEINKLGSEIKKCRVVLERLSDQEINKLDEEIRTNSNSQLTSRRAFLCDKIYTRKDWLAKNRATDSEEMRLARRKDFWLILEMAGLLVNWDQRYFIPSVVYISALVLNFTYFALCMLFSAFKSPDLINMCQFLNFLGLLMIAMVVVLVCVTNQENFIALTSFGAKGLFDYGNSFSGSKEIIEGWYKTGEILKKIMFIVVPPWLALIALSVMLSDLVDAAFSYPKTNETIINGLYQTLPLKMYCFHPIDNEFVRWLTILIQGACALGTALVITAGDMMMFFGGQHVIIQLKILNMAIRDIDNMAAKQYESELGRKPPTHPIYKTKDRQLMDFYKICLKRIIEHHKEILSCFEIYQRIISWPGGLMVVNGSIVVAMSMLSIMQGGGQPSVLLTSFLLIIAEVASILMACELGELIRNLCEELFDSMYSFDWMDCSHDIKRMIHIMKFRLRKPIILTAGYLTPIDRNTFSSMMNTAYSYINLALASGQGDAH